MILGVDELATTKRISATAWLVIDAISGAVSRELTGTSTSLAFAVPKSTLKNVSELVLSSVIRTLCLQLFAEQAAGDPVGTVVELGKHRVAPFENQRNLVGPLDGLHARDVGH
jgi:hypothetical protein